MSHPLEFIPRSIQKKVFFTLFALTLGLFGVFNMLDAPLRTSAAPNGIVSFELAGTPERADAILQSWDTRARLFAAFGLGLDYLFMPVYALTISLGVLMASRKQSGIFASIGAYVGWGALFSAFFDVIENFALWRLLSGWSVTPLCSRMATINATVKFILIGVSVFFALAGWLLPKKR